MYKASGGANTVLYDKQPTLVGAFSVIVQLRRLIVYSTYLGAGPRLLATAQSLAGGGVAGVGLAGPDSPRSSG